MKFCPSCGVKLDNDGFKFCPECGYKFESNTNNSNQNKKSEPKGFIGGFLKGIRDQIPDEYVDKIKDNETIDDAVTHAKIIWHGPQTEKEKAYKERKRQEEENKDPINYKISEITGKHLWDSDYFTERKKLFNVSDGYTYYKDILKWEVANYNLEYDDLEVRLDELLKIGDAKTIFELRFKHPTCLFKTREDLKNYIGHGTAKAPIPFTDEEIEKRKRDLEFAATLKNIQSKETDNAVNKIKETKQDDNQETEKPKVISATTSSEKESLTKQKIDEPNYNDLEFIKCACKITERQAKISLEGRKTSKRAETKELIKMLREKYENSDINIFNSTQNVNLETILSYKKDGKIVNFLDEY